MRYSYSTIITVLMFLRAYLLLRMFTRFTTWRTTLADRCCAKIGMDSETFFSLKCIYKSRPFSLLAFALVTSAVVFGFSIRLLERPYYDDEEVGYVDRNQSFY